MSETITKNKLIRLLIYNMVSVSTLLSSKDILCIVENKLIALCMWLHGAFLYALYTMCYSELGSAYPYSGGDVIYLSRAYNRKMGFVFLLTSLVVIIPGYFGLTCDMIHLQIKSVFDQKAFLTFSIILVCSWLLYMGKFVLITTTKYFFGFKLLIVLCLLIFSIMGFFKKGEVDFDFKKGVSLKNVLTAMLFSQWGYDGWNNAFYMADDIFLPEKTLKEASLISICCVWICTSIINLSFLMFIPYDVYVDDEIFIAVYFEKFGMRINRLLISLVFIVLPLFSSILTYMIVCKKIYKYLLRENLITNKNIYIVYVPIIIFTFIFSIVPTVITLSLIQSLSIAFHTLSTLALIILRLREPHRFMDGKVGYFVPVLTSLIGVFLLCIYAIMLFV